MRSGRPPVRGPSRLRRSPMRLRSFPPRGWCGSWSRPVRPWTRTWNFSPGPSRPGAWLWAGDGGTSLYKEAPRRAKRLAERAVRFLDAGTSGGIWGFAEGYCLMVGGDEDAFRVVTPILATLAPPGGYAYMGPHGAGHFGKMVHTGIEYGMMQSYAEGFELLSSAPFSLDLRAIASLWNQGSVVRSWLLELAERALEKAR